jgi:SNF2 family DNA or RNA helicase
VISPFILRRSKKEVLTDLPERSESNLLIELSNEEHERYDQVRLAAIGELDSLGDTEVSGVNDSKYCNC